MKKLIINADDFGLSRSINRGIIELFGKGAITSTSLLVNMPGFEDALKLIKENQSLCVGIHINVLRGKPICPVEKVSSLCEGGFFRGKLFSLAFLPYINKKILEEFAQECRAQIEKAISQGINITHMDSEKHIHLIQPFFSILLKIAQEYSISRIRCINESSYFRHAVFNPPYFLNKQLYAASYLSFCSMKNRKLQGSYKFNSPDYFYGVSTTGNMTLENITWALSNLRDGTTEFLCHPGYIDHEWQDYPLKRERYYINATRHKELSLLASPRVKELIKQQGILLMPYREL